LGPLNEKESNLALQLYDPPWLDERILMLFLMLKIPECELFHDLKCCQIWKRK